LTIPGKVKGKDNKSAGEEGGGYPRGVNVNSKGALVIMGQSFGGGEGGVGVGWGGVWFKPL